MPPVLFYVLLALFILGLIYDFHSTFSDRQKKKARHQRMASLLPLNDLLQTLTLLGYFKYVPKQHLASAQQIFGQRFDVNGIIPSYEQEGVIQDFKVFYLDHEHQSDLGGMQHYAEELQPYFAIRGLAWNIRDGYDEFDSANGQRRRGITINGRSYVIFNDEQPALPWITSSCRFVDLINQELALGGCDERLYLLGGDGPACFLSAAERAYFDRILTEPGLRPMTTEEWLDFEQRGGR